MEPSFKEDLNEYISHCRARLNSVLQGLGWTEAGTLKDYNANSIASCTRDKKKSCTTIKSTFPDSCVTKNSVGLDTPQLQALLGNNTLKAPDNFIELQGNFTRDQKLQLYEHAINNTKKLENNLFDKDVDGEISLSDILAQKKREEKSKKRRFRKSKPTHVEEVRCLVDLQMQALEQFLGNKIKKVQGTSQRRYSKQDEYGKAIEYSEGKRRLKDYDKKERHREMYRENQKQSSNYELSGAKSNDFKSRDRERRRRSVSSSKSIRQVRKKYRSKREHKSKERRKHRRRSRSRSKKVSKEKKYRSSRRSRSHDKKSSKEVKSGQGSSYEREDDGAYRGREKFTSNNKHLKEKYNKY